MLENCANTNRLSEGSPSEVDSGLVENQIYQGPI